MSGFVHFMASGAGRALRVLVGLALVAWGWFGLGGTTGILIAVIGLLPLVAGLFDFCVFAPLFGFPLGGKQIRASR